MAQVECFSFLCQQIGPTIDVTNRLGVGRRGKKVQFAMFVPLQGDSGAVFQ